eukprot:7388479-Prymnesium_polylepis.1
MGGEGGEGRLESRKCGAVCASLEWPRALSSQHAISCTGAVKNVVAQQQTDTGLDPQRFVAQRAIVFALFAEERLDCCLIPFNILVIRVAVRIGLVGAFLVTRVGSSTSLRSLSGRMPNGPVGVLVGTRVVARSSTFLVTRVVTRVGSSTSLSTRVVARAPLATGSSTSLSGRTPNGPVGVLVGTRVVARSGTSFERCKQILLAVVVKKIPNSDGTSRGCLLDRLGKHNSFGECEDFRTHGLRSGWDETMTAKRRTGGVETLGWQFKADLGLFSKLFLMVLQN